MRDEISAALQSDSADYIEIRIEEGKTSRLVYRGKRLEEAGRTSSLGGNVRALVNGGWGFVSFNEIHNLGESVRLAVKAAKLTGKEHFQLSPVKPIVDVVTPADKGVSVSLSEKKQLMDEYNDLILSTRKIQTSTIGYSDSQKKTTFANSEGTYIEQTRQDINLRLTAIAAENGEVQQVGLSIGSPGDFSVVQGLQSV
jgi:TldD protein